MRSKHLQFCSNKMLLANCARQIFFFCKVWLPLYVLWQLFQGFVLDLVRSNSRRPQLWYTIHKIGFENRLFFSINPLAPKIWLLTLPCYTFPCKWNTRIWCEIKITTPNWYGCVFLWPLCRIFYRFIREKLPINHFRKLKGYSLKGWLRHHAL